MALTVGKGRAAITLSGPLADGLEREIRTALGPVADRLEQGTKRILRDEIHKHWPVKSGRSLRAWRQTLRVHPGTYKVEATLLNAIRYVRYIRSRKAGEKRWAGGRRYRHVLTWHVRTPMKEERKKVRKELPDLLAQRLERAVNG